MRALHSLTPQQAQGEDLFLIDDRIAQHADFRHFHFQHVARLQPSRRGLMPACAHRRAGENQIAGLQRRELRDIVNQPREIPGEPCGVVLRRYRMPPWGFVVKPSPRSPPTSCRLECEQDGSSCEVELTRQTQVSGQGPGWRRRRHLDSPSRLQGRSRVVVLGHYSATRSTGTLRSSHSIESTGATTSAMRARRRRSP